MTTPVPLKILIVDDEERICQLLDDTLKARGFMTLIAANGEQALQVFQTHTPDLVITDIMLPKMDGFSLVKQIRALPAGQITPMIMMSAVFRDFKIQEKMFKEFRVEFLNKPFSLTSLLKLVQKSLRLPTSDTTSQPEAQAPRVAEPEAGPKQRGKVEHFSVPILLVSLYSEKKTGLLKFTVGGREQKVYLDQGLPVFAESRLRKADAAVSHEILRSVLALQSGQYEFEPWPGLPGDLPRYPVELLGLIYEGVKRYYRMDLLAQHFQQVQNQIVERQNQFEQRVARVGFNAEEKKLIAAIDDEKTVYQLATLNPTQIENFFQVLWVLNFLEVVKFKSLPNH